MYRSNKTVTIRFGDNYYRLVKSKKTPKLPKELEKILLDNKDIYTVGDTATATKRISRKSKITKETITPDVPKIAEEIIPEETLEIKTKDKKSRLTLWEEVSDE